MKKIILIVLVIIFITLVGIILFLSFDKNNLPSNFVYVKSINNEKIVLKEGQTYKNVKILKIKDEEVILGWNDKKQVCNYNKECEFWEDSMGGAFLPELPSLVLEFYK